MFSGSKGYIEHKLAIDRDQMYMACNAHIEGIYIVICLQVSQLMEHMYLILNLITQQFDQYYIN